MTTFLVVRHGQSQANLENCFAGCGYDTPLTALGLQQAQCTAAYIARNYTVDAVYASPLDRAFQTAKALADSLNLPVHVEHGVREIYGGEWERMEFAQIDREYRDAWVTWCTDNGHGYCPGGETVAQVQTRALEALGRIAAEHDGQTVVVTTHATPVFVLQTAAMGLPLEDVHGTKYVSNASVTTIRWDNGTPVLVEAGYDAHLAGLVTALPEELLSKE